MLKLPNGGLNGLMIEQIYNMTNYHQLIDDEINNIELKSCEEYIKNYTKKGLIRRHGRFHFDLEQHKYLLERDGDYLLVVHNTGLIRFTKQIKAKELIFKESVNWIKLF